MCVHLAVLEQRALQVLVDKVNVEPQHPHLGVLQNEESHVYGQGVRANSLIHLDLVRVVDDDVELSEPPIVDHDRCRRLPAVFHVTKSVHVGDCLPVARIPQQLHGVRDDGHVWMDISLAPGRRHCITEPPEARNHIVLDDLVDARHLEFVVQVPPQEGCGEKDLIASIYPHEHETQGRHDVPFGVSAHERIAIVAR